MQHRMAIRANGTQVVYRIDAILVSDFRQRNQVVHVNESGPQFAIRFLEGEFAHGADRTVMGNTPVARNLVALIS